MEIQEIYFTSEMMLVDESAKLSAPPTRPSRSTYTRTWRRNRFLTGCSSITLGGLWRGRERAPLDRS